MKAIFLILSIFFAASCSNDDENPAQQDNAILSTWNLIKYEPGFSPTVTYTNEIQWTFNSNNTIDVVIISGTDVNSNLPLNSSGSYSFSINGNEITIENVVYKFEINNNKLTIEDLVGQSADGKKLTFNKTQ